MRAVEWRDGIIDDTFVDFMSTCVQCRGCEPACPSGVPFGHLMEDTKSRLDTVKRGVSTPLRWGLSVLGHRRTLLAGSSLLALAQRLRLVPARAGLPRLPIRRGTALRGTGGDAWLFTGCVMDAWMRATHRATAALLDAVGCEYAIPSRGAACCGALHVHAGLHEGAIERARAVIRTMPGEAPIIVNSAGCGAAMKDYGRLLGTDESESFAARVVDIHEWLLSRSDDLPPPRGDRPVVIIQDPCHLRHVQKVHGAVRTLLGRVADLVELDDEGLCCGAGGAYSTLQPGLAGQIRERKTAVIIRAATASGASLVASANPGCLMHLANAEPLARAGITVRHPVDIVAAALGLGAE
jgi:glycolate oxidase iron-sulfur subunit